MLTNSLIHWLIAVQLGRNHKCSSERFHMLNYVMFTDVKENRYLCLMKTPSLSQTKLFSQGTLQRLPVNSQWAVKENSNIWLLGKPF